MCTFGLSACRRSFADASFERPTSGVPCSNLPLQVAEVDDVEIDDAERADAGRGQIHRRRRSEAAGADAQHLRGLQLALTVHADLRQDQVPAVAPDLVAGELRQRRVLPPAPLPPATDGMMLTVSPALSGV